MLLLVAAQMTNAHVEKYLLALRCLKATLSLDASSPKAHEQAIQLRHALNTDLATLSPKVAEVIRSEFTEVPASADLAKVNQEFRGTHKASAQHVLASIRVQAVLGEDRGKLGKDVVGLLQIPGLELEDAVDAQELLVGWKSAELDDFKKAAAGKWPEASLFA